MSRNQILLDFSNLAYMSLFAATRQPEYLEDGYDGHYHIFINKVMNIMNKMYSNETDIIFVLDSFPEAKKMIYPEYKNGRKKFNFDPKKGLLTALSSTINFKIAKHKGYEADDVIASLSKHNQEKPTIIVSSDKDLWVLMKYNNVNIYDINKNEYATYESFVEKFKIQDYKHLTLVKSLWGDRSDNIPNVMPLTQKAMMPIIANTDGTLSSFIEEAEKQKHTFSKSVASKYEVAQNQLIDNYSLVLLYEDLNVEVHDYYRGLEYNI